MGKRVFLLVLDSLGVGAMKDTITTRPQDQGANTFYHILDQTPISLPTLERLGVNQILKHPSLGNSNPMGSYGQLNLQHDGADSYAGHQEIMGTKPMKPLLEPFIKSLGVVKAALEKEGYGVAVPDLENPYLLVENKVVVADNIETDYGQIYNVSGPLDEIPFTEIVNIGKIVRGQVKVNRVIALGGEGITAQRIIDAVEKRADGLVGVNSPKSGVYHQGYQALHLGYGVDPSSQISTLLATAGKEVVLIGKMQDVITCRGAKRIPAVETTLVMETILQSMDGVKEGFVAATVQETDLAGHAQNPVLYGEKLQIVDRYLATMIDRMKKEDMLIITADHGNDPTIGHSQHTREKTLLLVYGKELASGDLGEGSTLSDIAATIADYFQVPFPQNGKSFYHLLKRG